MLINCLFQFADQILQTFAKHAGALFIRDLFRIVDAGRQSRLKFIQPV